MFNIFGKKNRWEDESQDAREARSAMAHALAEMVLNDRDVPENKKVNIRIVLEAEKLADKICEIAKVYTWGEPDEATAEKNYKVRREVLEYIGLVSAGIDVFLESHPAPRPEERAEETV